MAEQPGTDATRISTERMVDIAGLASLASPMHAALAPYVGAGSSAGPGAGMLRNAVRRFVESVRSRVIAAAQHEGPTPGADLAVAASVEAGIASVVAGYRARGTAPAGRISAVQGTESAASADRVRGMATALARSAARKLDVVRDHLAPLAKFVDGAHVASYGSGPALYPALARAVLIATVVGGATVTMSGGALAGPTQVEIDAARSGVTVDDLFKQTFGGMKKPVTAIAPVGVRPGQGAPSASLPTAVPAPVSRTFSGEPIEPSAEFRTLAESYLKIQGGHGDQAFLALAKLQADGRICARQFTSGMDCRVTRDGVSVDMVNGRFDIRRNTPSGPGAPLVTEVAGGGVKVVDAAGFAMAMRATADAAPVQHKDVRPQRRVGEGRPYFSPSNAFVNSALAITAISLGSAEKAERFVLKAVEDARACATGPARPEGCLVRADGLSLDMSLGRFSIDAPIVTDGKAKVLVSETVEQGFQVPDPVAFARTMKNQAALNNELIGDLTHLGGPRR